MAFVPSSSSTTRPEGATPASSGAGGEELQQSKEKRSAAEVPEGERRSKSSHVEPPRGSTRTSPSDPVLPSRLNVDELGSVTIADLDDFVTCGKWVFGFSKNRDKT